MHGMDKIAPHTPVGADILIIGAGPTGLILAQLLKMNGAARVVVAANKGIKTEMTRTLNSADVLVELDRADPAAGWTRIKEENPYGFDVVVSNQLLLFTMFN
jgi:D-arabinitol dehydrogenase (NADP+)